MDNTWKVLFFVSIAILLLSLTLNVFQNCSGGETLDNRINVEESQQEDRRSDLEDMKGEIDNLRSKFEYTQEKIDQQDAEIASIREGYKINKKKIDAMTEDELQDYFNNWDYTNPLSPTR